MQISILCVGKVREKFFREAIQEYDKRMSRYAKVQILEVADEKTPDRASVAEEEQIREKEADRLLKQMRDNMYIIALDIQGSQQDSVGFSEHLSKLMVSGKSHIAFVIGGSLGLHHSVLSRADEKISFSKMTFPHQLMRVILYEQLYRAMRIMHGEPYHK